MTTIWDRLAEPFPRDKEKFYPMNVSQKGSATAGWYIDARAASERFDEVLGPDNWKFEWKPIDGISAAESVHGILSIRVTHGDGSNEWVSKEDVGYRNAKNDEEPIKSAVSDALKRCAAHWGIGRYLYRIPMKWFKCELEGGKFKSWIETPTHPPVTSNSAPIAQPEKPAQPTKPAQPVKPTVPEKPTTDHMAEMRASFERGKTRARSYPIDMSKYESGEQLPEAKLKKLYADLTQELSEYEILKESDPLWVNWLEVRAQAVALSIPVPPENTFKLPMPRDTVTNAINSVSTVIESKEK